jgi:hypothetical protein
MIDPNKLELFCVEYRRFFFIPKLSISFKNKYRLYSVHGGNSLRNYEKFLQ